MQHSLLLKQLLQANIHTLKERSFNSLKFNKMGKNTGVTPAQDQTITIPAGNTEAAMVQAQQEIDKAIEKEVDKSDAPETVATEQARTKVLVEQSGYSLGDMANSAPITTKGLSLAAHPNDVNFNVTDPGKTSLQKGITVVSKEVAEQFEKAGYGKIVK